MRMRDIDLFNKRIVFFSFCPGILGGGYTLGSLVMVMEDPEAPHHMDLLRTFMSQGLVNNQPLLYASPSKDPRGFLGTLPHSASSKEDKPTAPNLDQVLILLLAPFFFFSGMTWRFSYKLGSVHCCQYCRERIWGLLGNIGSIWKTRRTLLVIELV